ncbi:MAG: hypothetical protein ABFS03_06765 [Chloroflexota bacterium]
MSQKIVVLSKQSLLADGIASLLSAQPHLFTVDTLDATQVKNIGDELSAETPDIIIVDASDESLLVEVPISSLLELLPMTKIIQFNSCNDKIQVFTSEHRRLGESSSLITILQEAVSR